MNWARILETFGTSIFIAFLIFAGGRFGVFERTVVMQDTMKEDITALQECNEKIHAQILETQSAISGLKATAAVYDTTISNLNKDIRDIRQRQQDYFIRNQQERRQDIEELKNYLKK
jgi:predicted RNase H-like nuclease (RuvC/YqgF family)